jgi:hypothetical protein
MDRRTDSGKNKVQLANLRALAATPPKTKSGQVVWAWPEIQASLKSGRNLKEIWEALQLDGIVMSYDQFRVYVSRIRRRFAGRTDVAHPPTGASSDLNPQPGASSPARDPLANIRQELERKQTSGFHYDPFPDPQAEAAAGTDVHIKGARTPKPSDPLENYRRRVTKRPAFDYRPELANPKDLV